MIAASRSTSALGAQGRIAGIGADDTRLSVTWEDAHMSVFHHMWLRDNCNCPECGGDPMDNRRRLKIGDIPPDVRPVSFRVDEQGILCITWAPTHHVSMYDPAWLRLHCYCPDDRSRRRHRPILWDAKLGENVPQIAYQDVVGGERGQLRMLEMVRDYGLALLRAAPPLVGTLEQVADLVGYVREFGYGRVFDIVWKQDQKSIAQSKETILPHTDEPFRYHPPGISLFHCIQSSMDGKGESILVDGFMIVERLRRTDPDAVELLNKVPQSWYMRHVNGELYRADGRLICLDVDGRVSGVRFNDRCHAPIDLPDHLVEPFYAALRKLSAAYSDPTFWLRLLLGTGDLLVYDNERLLHGRNSFQGDRFLRLCAVERDEFHSRLRVLGDRLGKQDSDLILASGVGV